jgi:hypothetical protein
LFASDRLFSITQTHKEQNKVQAGKVVSMASHLRSRNESAWQRGLQGDAASEDSGPDISFIIASAGLLVAFFAIIL